MKQKTKETPMMRQYLEIKKKYQDEILFFRMGDFYEMFLEDAVYASKILDIALTKRQDKIPMCGIPYHALANYVHPILESGRKIAICEQVEDPQTVSGRIVKRDVTRILTPGSIFEESLLSSDERRLLASVVAHNHRFIVAMGDLSTGDLSLEQCEAGELLSLLKARDIKETIVDKKFEPDLSATGILLIERNYQQFSEQALAERVKKRLQVTNIDALEIDEIETRALAYLFYYIDEIAPGASIFFKNPAREYTKKFLYLDDAALRTLEIVSSQSGSARASLFGVLDFNKTAAGRRLMRNWLSMPSGSKAEIEARHSAVAYLVENAGLREKIDQQLKLCSDLERVLVQLQNSPQVRHLGQVRDTLQAIRQLATIVASYDNLPSLFQQGFAGMQQFPGELDQELTKTLLADDLPPVLDERRFINAGISEVLDELCQMNTSAHTFLREYEAGERETHGIPTLKVKYNKVIGYFIEISKGAIDKAPPEYMRRQTLVGGERYTTDELKELENKILNAKDEIITLQKGIFQTLCAEVLECAPQLIFWAGQVAQLDVLLSFATAALQHDYRRPTMTTDGRLELKASRHPVVEALFKEEVFVPNDARLEQGGDHLAILTGPNMAGKSTFIRQIGLVQIMAQAGSFVPAEQAHLSICDRVFTRIGAFDRLFQGESTFFVEMAECARIFQNFSPSSLILLDEVGRGTSTFDGISIARAMIEYLNDNNRGRPKTLFATHYAELSGMIGSDNGIMGLTVQVLEENGKIVFLRKIIEGSADKSYGIYVADLAGLPKDLIVRAESLLQELETDGLWHAQPVFKSQSDNSKKTKASKKSLALKNQPTMFD